MGGPLEAALDISTLLLAAALFLEQPDKQPFAKGTESINQF